MAMPCRGAVQHDECQWSLYTPLLDSAVRAGKPLASAAFLRILSILVDRRRRPANSAVVFIITETNLPRPVYG